MVVPLFRLLIAGAFISATLAVQAQPVAGADALPKAPTAFVLEIHAPEDIERVLMRNLELRRYQEMPDLSDAEIQSLLHTAQQDASNLLATLGYFSPAIRFQLLPATEPAGRLVRVDVQSGPPTKVTGVQLILSGPIAQDAAAKVQRQRVQDEWSLPEDEQFSQAAWEDAKENALEGLLSHRYAAARVESARADIDADYSTATLELRLHSGPAYRIGRQNIQGSTHYSDLLVRRLARLHVGDDYDLTQLVEAQQRLTDSGYYDAAYLHLDLDSDPDAAVVQTQVKEAARQKLVLGIGASTDTGARWSTEYTHHQVPGIGWRTVNKISGDRNTHSFNSDWTSQPDESLWRWASSVFVSQSNIAAVDVNTQRLRQGRFATDTRLEQSFYAQWERSEVLYQENGEQSASEALSGNYTFALRRFDSIPFPTQGWGLGVELALGSVLGSQQEPFARVLAHGRYYQSLAREGAKLFNRQRSGRMVYRAQLGGVFVDQVESVPYSQLFLTGGDSTVRGYQLNEIGLTQNGLQSAVAGRYLATGGVEWQRAIVRGGIVTDWEGVLFVDTGAVANRMEEMHFKVGLGFGARWKSPIGPLQLDLAYGVATEALRLHLNVGFVF
ncbi:MAG: BamA/TamA family outer membrane protein [Rhodoferax sp.]|nr:BamA/TamA family outer membrane protein [Rhodoferax sp.]